MFFALPSTAFSMSDFVEGIRGSSARSSCAKRASRRLRAVQYRFVAARMSPRLRAVNRDGAGATVHLHRNFYQLQKIAPRGETRLDGANKKNISLHAQGPTPRNLSNCASSSRRSWPTSHDLRSVYPATSPLHSRSETAARAASADVRPSRNDLLAR